MTDYTDLKRLAEAASGKAWYSRAQSGEGGFTYSETPNEMASVILSLLAENEGMREAERLLHDALAFAFQTGGTCMGLAMSGPKHPNPDEILMDLFKQSQTFIRAARAHIEEKKP